MERRSPPKAKELIAKILRSGVVHYSKPHALDMLKKRKITMMDCENVLRRGIVEEAEFENGGWRHRVRTMKFQTWWSFCPRLT